MLHRAASFMGVQPPRPRQRGSALITAMVIVTLVTTMAASMMWQQWRAVQVEAAERASQQSQWVLSGALDWGRMILREDARNGGPDHLGEPWAVPLAEARLSSFLSTDKDNSADAEGPEAFLSGSIVDAQGKYNLYNVINVNTLEVDAAQLKALQRLCVSAGLSAAVADQVAQGLYLAWMARRTADPAILQKLGGEAARATATLAPQTLDQLVWIGLDAGTIERMRPWAVMLHDASGPLSGTTVNLNTASREVIAAAIPGLDPGLADRVVQARQRRAFRDVQELTTLLANSSLNLTGVDIRSEFFEVSGRIRLDDQASQQRYLVRRSGNGDVNVLLGSRTQGLDMAPEAVR